MSKKLFMFAIFALAGCRGVSPHSCGVEPHQTKREATGSLYMEHEVETGRTKCGAKIEFGVRRP